MDPEVLTKAPLFAELDDESATALEQAMGTLRLSKGEILFREGETEDRLYVVVAGKIKLGRSGSAGRENLLAVLGPGQMFGAMSSLGDPVHQRTATALVGSCLLRIGQEAFREVMVENPVVGLRVVDDLAARLSRAQSDMGRQSTATVEQRVARALLRLADSLGEDRGAQGLLLEVPLSRADLAGLARSTPESVSRVMSALRREGVIDSGRRWTSILDRDALEERAEDT